MLVVHVHVRVTPESVEGFRAATLENARNSIEEPGVVRFDVLQREDDPTRFLLQEIYRTPEAPERRSDSPIEGTWRRERALRWPEVTLGR